MLSIHWLQQSGTISPRAWLEPMYVRLSPLFTPLALIGSRFAPVLQISAPPAQSAAPAADGRQAGRRESRGINKRCVHPPGRNNVQPADLSSGLRGSASAPLFSVRGGWPSRSSGSIPASDQNRYKTRTASPLKKLHFPVSK